VLILAVARPSAVVTLPTQHQTVILAMDISGSMRATDVEPNRIAAAQAAAKAFVADQPRGTRIGVVTFAGSAALAQAPTDNREEILAAIDRIQLQRATAIGSGILSRSRRFSLRPNSTCTPSTPGDARLPARRPDRPGPHPQKPAFQNRSRPAPTGRPSSSC
jgi:uncharacterized protein (DUF58 family)